MAIRTNNAEGGTNGSLATIQNSGGGSGTAFDSVTGAINYVTGLRGSLAYKTTAATTQYTQWSLTDTVINLKALVRFDTAPASNTVLRIGLSSSSITLIVLSSGRPQLFSGGTARASGATGTELLANTNYRMALWCDTTAGSIRASIYNAANDALVWDSGVITGLTLASPTVAQVGKYDTTSIATTWDEISAKSASDGAYENNAITDPLSTPVVTLGTTTNASTVGGTGSQVVTWTAVSNAVSYEAWLANNTSPAQGDFTLVASGVTSPYTFTNVAAGQHAYGIKAKA